MSVGMERELGSHHINCLLDVFSSVGPGGKKDVFGRQPSVC